MRVSIARILSTIAHPVFVNLLCLYLLFSIFPPLSHGLPQRIQLFYISFIFISTGIIPLILVVVMRITGKIQSITLEDRKDRKLPYLLTISLYAFNIYTFIRTPTTHPLILGYLLTCMIIVSLVFFINFSNKISIHMATLGAMCGLVGCGAYVGFTDLRFILFLFIILSGLVATARLSLNAHTPSQLYAGFLLGFTCMFIIMMFSFTFA
jgi:membrane-associated phospholipid phosphatase